MTPLLTIRNLSVGIRENLSYKKVLEDFHLEIQREEIVALVGASGSGKTTTGLAILGLLAEGIDVLSGEIFFEEKNLLTLRENEMQSIRGKDIGMVFQEPLSALNPLFTIGFQIEEVLKEHTSLRYGKRKEKVLEILSRVGIDEPKRIAQSYPHQLSGGLRQRAMIAQAIAAGPKLIIADEPTSNLDVTIQAHILQLFRNLKSEFKISTLLITHDLGVVRALADRVAVLQHGKVIEEDSAENIFQKNQNPLVLELKEAAGL